MVKRKSCVSALAIGYVTLSSVNATKDEWKHQDDVLLTITTSNIQQQQDLAFDNQLNVHHSRKLLQTTCDKSDIGKWLQCQVGKIGGTLQDIVSSTSAAITNIIETAKTTFGMTTQQVKAQASNQQTTAAQTMPTTGPTYQPTKSPTDQPTWTPADLPSVQPTDQPTEHPTYWPTKDPTHQPTASPI